MAVTPVKIGGAGSTTSAQTSIVSALTAGASIGDVVVFIASIGTAKQGTTPTDTKGNTWNLIAQPQSGANASCNMWYSVITVALTTSDTITTTWTGSVARRSWTVLKCSGLTATPLDKSGSTSAATVTSLSLTTTTSIAQADELVIAAYGWDETASATNAVMSADTGYAVLDQELAGGGGTNQVGVGVEWKETAATATITASPTMNETCAGLAGVIATFKVASSGSALDAGALSIAGAGNIAIASAQQGFLAGAFTIPGAGNIAVSGASQGIQAGAFTIPGAGNIVISASQLAQFVGALTIPGTGNILLGSNIISSKDLGALVVTGAGSIAVSAADLAHFTGALTIPGAGSIAISSTRQGFLAGALTINGAGTINTSGISTGGNVVVGALTIAGSGLISVTAAQLAQLLGALSIAGAGDIEAAFSADPNAPIIITRLNDGDLDPNFIPYFF